MTEIAWLEIVASLQTQDTKFEQGLSDLEIERVERAYGFRFPPDLRAFLQTALPVGDRFPNWRSGDMSDLKGWMRWPLEGICFDIEHNAFWLENWGPRPTSLNDAFHIATQQVAAAPVLIPIYSHRFIPDKPHATGNPVFSVYQTDIIYYGYDLMDYLAAEFGIVNPTSRPTDPRYIEFWDTLLS